MGPYLIIYGAIMIIIIKHCCGIRHRDNTNAWFLLLYLTQVAMTLVGGRSILRGPSILSRTSTSVVTNFSTYFVFNIHKLSSIFVSYTHFTVKHINHTPLLRAPLATLVTITGFIVVNQ